MSASFAGIQTQSPLQNFNLQGLNNRLSNRLSNRSQRDIGAQSGGSFEAKQSLRLAARSLEFGDDSYSRSSLKVRSSSELLQSDDGSVRAASQSKLRFKYDFVDDDGTRISIRAKANLSYEQSVSADGNSQSLRLRARTSISIVQTNVANGSDELSQINGISDQAKETIGAALELFQKVTDSVTAQAFTASPIDGDSLIAGLVEAFNDFTTSVLTPFTSPAIEGTAPPSADSDVVEGEVISSSIEPVPAPVVPTVQPVPAVLPAPTEPVSSTEADGAAQENPEREELSIAETDGPDVQRDAENDDEAARGSEVVSPQPAEAQASENRAVAESILVKLRYQVVESLQQIVGEFGSESDPYQYSASVYRASARLKLRIDNPANSYSEPALLGRRVDFNG